MIASVAQLNDPAIGAGACQAVAVGLDVEARDESGRVLGEFTDRDGRLAGLFLGTQDEATKCLQFISPAVDTTFNYLQAAVLDDEFQSLMTRLKDDADREVVQKVLEVLRWVRNRPHHVVCFIGD